MFFDERNRYDDVVNVVEPITTTGDGYVTRYAGNPILQSSDVPYESAMVYNAGVTRYNGRYVMVFRNDWGDFKAMLAHAGAVLGEGEKGFDAGPWGCNLGLAFSDDGLKWEVEPEPCWAVNNEEVKRVYDPRLTVIDGKCYMCFAMDTVHGTRGGVAVTEDFKDFEILSVTGPDNRNLVLFPEKVNGRYVRLERPFPMYQVPEVRQNIFDIWCSESPDMRFWGETRLVLGGETVPFANGKIGPGAPPIKTAKGWLTLFHGVRHEDEPVGGWEKLRPWRSRYMIGVMLLDLDDPGKVLGYYDKPLMTSQPDNWYEMEGCRNCVLFPTGLLDKGDGRVAIYYGGADTYMALATAEIDTLIQLCLEEK